MGQVWTADSGGVRWRMELDDERLLPGRALTGRLVATADHGYEARGLVVTLSGEERYRYVVSNGKTSTIVTGRDDLPPVPVIVSGPVRMEAGVAKSFPLSVPVPPLGPASLDATEAAIEWTLEAKLDRPGGLDSAIVAPVTIAQPVALLRAGVVHVGEFALYDAADAEAAGITGSIRLDPVPLVTGEPFTGSLVLNAARPLDVQEVRVEVRVEVRCTRSSGRSETFTPFAAVVAGPGQIAGTVELELSGILEGRALPTIERENLRTDAEVHVILARRLARDPHLVREVAIATTSAL